MGTNRQSYSGKVNLDFHSFGEARWKHTFNNNNKIIIWAEGRGDSFSTRRPDDVLLSVADMFPEQNNALLGVSK